MTYADIVQSALEIKTAGLWVIVSVRVDLQTGMFENGGVIAPRRTWQVDFLVAFPPRIEESATDSQGTGATDGLNGGN